MRSLFFILSGLIASARALTFIVNVGGNTTDNPGAVFSPESVDAEQYDLVYFNFTIGNHTATQSTFSSPCIPVDDTDSSVNGFDSGFRNANDGLSVTNLTVNITNPNITIWFYDANTCGLGGVGGININTSSTATLDGFKRNAIRLNGTGSTSTSSSSAATSSATEVTEPTSISSATRALFVGRSFSLPLLLLAILLGLSL